MKINLHVEVKCIIVTSTLDLLASTYLSSVINGRRGE